MASTKELAELFKRGELGKLLANTFNGERGRVNPCADSDLLVIFKSEDQTPSAEKIGETVRQYYSNLGYVVDDESLRDNSFEANIYSKSEDGFVSLVITTHYPFPAPGQGRASLRITSNICV